jgi:transcription antitermination factor NusG
VERCAAVAGRIEGCDSGPDGHSVSASAPGAWHPECGANSENPGAIKSATNWGGSRVGAGRKPASVTIGSVLGPRWYCVEVAPRAERLVAAEIEALGLPALAPEYLGSQRAREVLRGVVRIVHRDVLLPAFPRYVFAEFDASGRGWRKIATRPGVKRLMGGDPERPQAVAPVQMAWVIGQFGEHGVQRLPSRASEALKVGAVVRVVAGPLDGHVATVLASNGRTVSIEWAGRPVKMAQAAVAVCA